MIVPSKLARVCGPVQIFDLCTRLVVGVAGRVARWLGPCGVFAMNSLVVGGRRVNAEWFSVRSGVISAIVCASGGMALGGGGNDGAMRFVDATESSGLVFTQRHGPSPRYSAFLGGGSVADFNNDGFNDLYALGNGGTPDCLFINNGDGTFTDQARDWGMNDVQYAYGSSSVDFNNDGYLDLFVTSYGSVLGGPSRTGELKLLMNNGPDAKGNWSFTNVALEGGVNMLDDEIVDGTGTAWGDIDLDGDLDLFVGAYYARRQLSKLFRNDGPDEGGVWRFTDITVESGVVSQDWSVFVPGFMDVNNDRYPELIAISDHGSSLLFLNNQDGTFTDRTDLAPRISGLNGMGLDFGDVNRDGLVDFYATNIHWNGTQIGNQLLVQQPDGSFEDTSLSSDCYAGYWGWGCVMADLDHDGDTDIVETNGMGTGVVSSPAVLFENNGDGSSFEQVAEQSGLVHTLLGRGLVKFDADNDGDLDIAIYASGQDLSFYRNEIISEGSSPKEPTHWVRVLLDTRDDDRLAPQGIGAVVTVRAGGEDWVMPMHSGSSHCSSSPVEVHAGIGANTTIDVLRVAWADGSFTTMTDVDADQILTIAAPRLRADLDGSGVVDFMDIESLVSRFIGGDLSVDYNGDWRLNLQDVFAFLSEFNNEFGG